MPICYSYPTQLKEKCLSTLCPFVYLCFPVDTKEKFCYDDIYSNIENRPLTDIYAAESCEKGEFPHAKETDHLHERRTPLLPIRL